MPSPRSTLVSLAGVQVFIALALLLLLGMSFASSISGSSAEAEPVIGTKEIVRITGVSGESVEVLARVDTGATSTSIDEGIAEDLGYDLDDADTVTIVSSLGRDERPVVSATLTLAGTTFGTEVNVADRSERSTEVLLGRTDLERFSVSVGDELLTTPDSRRAPSAVDGLLAQSSVLGATALLAVLPLAVLLIVLLRVVFGITVLGTFSPVLLAIGYTQAGLVPGVALTLAMFVLGFAVQPALRRLRLPRVVRLAVLVGAVASSLVYLQTRGDLGPGADSWGAALPIVVTAVIVERLWETWDADGLGEAVRGAAKTLAVATGISLVMLTPLIRAVAETVPLQLAVVATLLTCLAGAYRGLRVNELLRFRAMAAAHADERPKAGVR